MPSRKIISILIITCALVVGIILASGKKATQNNKEQIVALKTPEVKLSAPSTEEWKKDLSILPTSDTSALTEDQTLTSQISQSLVANYLAMKQQGALDSASAQNLIDQASEAALLPAQNKYTSASIIISENNSRAAIRAYGDSLGGITKINRPPVIKNEMVVFQEMLKNKDASRAAELKEIAAVYRNLAIGYSKITEVPSSYSSLHLELINGLDQVANSLNDMAGIFEDPIKSLRAIGIYKSAYINILYSTDKIRMKILQDNVIYKQEESGYYFYYGI